MYATTAAPPFNAVLFRGETLLHPFRQLINPIAVLYRWRLLPPAVVSYDLFLVLIGLPFAGEPTLFDSHTSNSTIVHQLLIAQLFKHLPRSSRRKSKSWFQKRKSEWAQLKSE